MKINRTAPCLAAVLFALHQYAAAGSRIEYTYTLESQGRTVAAESQPAKRTFEIDGPRFRIRRSGGIVETSLDDGANTFFGDDHKVTQSPLATEHGGLFAPVTAWTEDETLSVGESTEGIPHLGRATRIYQVVHKYITVARIAFVFTRRFHREDRYTMTVADLDTSPAAVRVMLSRGYGFSLARQAGAFKGFPLMMDGCFVEQDSDRVRQKTCFRYEVTSIEPWDWPQPAQPEAIGRPDKYN
jgi:hypothetical protein